MSDIRLLDSSVINLIAAGEVVDRPASAVKELVENAIDAGAKHISVEIRRGGLAMIRISDDGCGMSSENAKRAFLKHATSKIATREDLNRIETLGFRGEALAAISAVSKITLTTKERGTTSGTKLEVIDGSVVSESECGCPDGSCFTVSDLFYNTPARLKFMKSEPAEAGAVQSVVERLSLSHPQISFRFTVNGVERLLTPGRDVLKEAVFSVFGKEFAEMSLPVDKKIGNVRVYGYVGKPVYSKANRNRQVFFLNGRYVRSPILTAGLENSYHNKMLIGRVPVCVLFVELPPELVDVNVHPGKMEVKFSDENAVAYAVRSAVESALAADSGIVEMRVPAAVEEKVPSPLKSSETIARMQKRSEDVPKPEPKAPASVNVSVPPKKQEEKSVEKPREKIVAEKEGWVITVKDPAPTRGVEPAPSTVVFRDLQPSVAPAPKEVPPVVSAFPPVNPNPPAVRKISVPERVVEPPKETPVLFQVAPSFRIVGEAFDCYIMVEKDDDLLFLDKHALHERMNFERLKKSEIAAQSLLRPIVLNFGSEENRVLAENADFLARFGFLLEIFGDDLLIREIPALIDPEQAEPLLQRFADTLVVGRDDSVMDSLYYDLACKASIRSGSKTTAPELRSLVEEYFARKDELQYCPHGRPIVFSLTKKSIEKQFKRVK